MNLLKTLIESDKLELVQATKEDIDYILQLTNHPENRQYVTCFQRTRYETALESGEELPIIVVEKSTGNYVGYFLASRIKTKVVELAHVVIDKKGCGYGHESLKLIKAWLFDVKNVHKIFLDCKDYNQRALHLYESEGFIREGFLRECMEFEGKFENLILFGILRNEYESRKTKKLEISDLISRANDSFEILSGE